MTNPVLLVKNFVAHATGEWLYRGGLVYCPACAAHSGGSGLHLFRLPAEDGTRPPEGPVWGWDGNTERPTFEGSMLVHEGGNQPRCHSFVRQGVWEYLGDCTHAMAGQRVPLPPLPDWLVRDEVDEGLLPIAEED